MSNRPDEQVEAEPEATPGADCCLVDLGKLDTYPRHIVPDQDIETCLKVLRTLRSLCLSPDSFDAQGAVLMSHTHAHIHDLVKQVQEEERRTASAASPTPEATDTTCQQQGVDDGPGACTRDQGRAAD